MPSVGALAHTVATMTHTSELSAALAGRYKIEEKIGVGGMATVYRARDLKHDRPVALKVLKPELGAQLGPERFLAEIRFTANLQHPNLLPLFDSGTAEGLLFYVMPFVNGETLRERLRREKQLPIGEAVRIAVAIAGALDYAHRHGIVHRDLKPENILLHEGEPLVADFGIALAVTNAGGHRITQTGLSLGTPQYMSPEQATGDRQIDGRSDVYSLAAVLYEMLAGDPPHLGSTAQAIVAKVLTETPRPLRAIRPSVPAWIDEAVLRGLEKLPADRFGTARELADALREPAVATRSPTGTSGLSLGPRHDRSVRSLGRAVAWFALGLVAAAAASAWMQVARKRPQPTTRFVLNIPQRERFLLVNGVPVVFSPDGRAVVYAGAGGPNGRQLYYRRLDELDAHPLPGTEIPSTLFFSPDGKKVGFSQNQFLKVVSISGGPPVTLAVGGFRSPIWAANGDIYAGTARGLIRIRAGEQAIDTLTKPDSVKGELSHGTPILAPDGKSLVYWVRTIPPRPDHLAILELDSKRIHDIAGASYNPIAILDGYLFFGRMDGTIDAVRYDPETLRSLDGAVTLLDGVTRRGTGGTAASFSRDGSLVYVRGGLGTQLVVTDETGKVVGTPTEVRDFTDPYLSPPSFSPDGRRVAISIFESATADIWLYDLSTSILSRLTSHRGSASTATWTPDGKRVAFLDRSAAGSIWWIPIDGSAPEERLASLPQPVRRIAFSPDGNYLVVNTGPWAPEDPGTADLLLLPLHGPREPSVLVRSTFNELNPAVSPDGKWLAYQSNVTGRYEIYLRSFRAPGPATQLSATRLGASFPQWTRDGRLMYRVNDSIVVATVTTTPEPILSSQRALFELTGFYSVSPDGKRFAVLRSTEGADQEVIVALNWLSEQRTKLAELSGPPR